MRGNSCPGAGSLISQRGSNITSQWVPSQYTCYSCWQKHTRSFMSNSLKLGTNVWHGNEVKMFQIIAKIIQNDIRIHVSMKVCVLLQNWFSFLIPPFDWDFIHIEQYNIITWKRKKCSAQQGCHKPEMSKFPDISLTNKKIFLLNGLQPPLPSSPHLFSYVRPRHSKHLTLDY